VSGAVLHRERRLVTMGDTDASGLIFYPAVSRWAAETFDHWLLAVDTSLKELFARGQGTPIVHVAADIRAPLGLSDVVQTTLSVAHIGTTSMRLRFECIRADGELAVVVETTHVFVRLEQDGGFGPPRIQKEPIPPWFRELLGQPPAP
jgi:4-hydroxybenzoyl-CoA thioesterase